MYKLLNKVLKFFLCHYNFIFNKIIKNYKNIYLVLLKIVMIFIWIFEYILEILIYLKLKFYICEAKKSNKKHVPILKFRNFKFQIESENERELSKI